MSITIPQELFNKILTVLNKHRVIEIYDWENDPCDEENDEEVITLINEMEELK